MGSTPESMAEAVRGLPRRQKIGISEPQLPDNPFSRQEGSVATSSVTLTYECRYRQSEIVFMIMV